MAKKGKNLGKYLIRLVLYCVATMAIFIILNSIHSSSCCVGLTECPLYKCNKDSSNLILFYVVVFLLFFSATGVLIEIKNVIKKLC